MNTARLAVAVVVITAYVCGQVAAQPAATQDPLVDRIWLEPPQPTATESSWYPRSIENRWGKIVGFDAKQLQFVVQGDEVATPIKASRLLWVEPAGRAEKEANALRLFADGKFDEAVRPLLNALEDRPPIWRQQWLSMQAAYAAWRSSRGAIALELVAQLDKRPLPPLIIAYLPVAWRRGGQHADAIDAAKTRLTDDSPAVRLVAASWLLSSADRSAAMATLKQLAVDDQRPHIARLAEALLWRIATPQQVSESLDAWQKKLDSMPMVLQVGPTIAWIEKLQSAGQSETAERLTLSLTLTPPLPHPDIEALRK